MGGRDGVRGVGEDADLYKRDMAGKSRCKNNKYHNDTLADTEVRSIERKHKGGKQGSTPTSWARGLRDQIQKRALQTQKNLRL